MFGKRVKEVTLAVSEPAATIRLRDGRDVPAADYLTAQEAASEKPRDVGEEAARR